MLNELVYHSVILMVLAIGLYNLITTRHVVKAILIIEMMLSSINLLIIQAAIRNGNDPLGNAVVITSIVIGAGLTAFLLSLSIKTYRETGTLDLEKLNQLRW